MSTLVRSALALVCGQCPADRMLDLDFTTLWGSRGGRPQCNAKRARSWSVVLEPMQGRRQRLVSLRHSPRHWRSRPTDEHPTPTLPWESVDEPLEPTPAVREANRGPATSPVVDKTASVKEEPDQGDVPAVQPSPATPKVNGSTWGPGYADIDRPPDPI